MEHEYSKSKTITAATYIYMVLPFIIFAIGWFKAYLGVPIVGIILYCTWKAWKETPSFWIPGLNRDTVIKILFISTVLSVWVYFSGIGFRVFQNSDHTVRNAIFEALVDCSWPVFGERINSVGFPTGRVSTLIYYIGFWLPAAVIGKIFGMQTGYTFQMIWAFIGLFLVYYYMCARKKKLLVWPILLLLFFSGLDIAGMGIRGINVLEVAYGEHLEWWASPYQYSSMTTQLFWVFNQSLPAWLCTIFIMQQQNNRSIVFVLASVMLNSTFPFVGLLVLAEFWVIGRKYDIPKGLTSAERTKCWLTAWVKDTFTIQNILGGGIMGIFTFLYLQGNIAASGISAQGSASVFESIRWPQYWIFILFEAGIYLILIYRYNMNNGTYFVVMLSLLIIPLVKGNSGDYCMRVSVPALFVLMILVQDALEEAAGNKERIWLCSLIVTVCIGAVTPLHEITRTVQKTIECQKNGTAYGSTIERQRLLNGVNFSGNIDESFFFKHIAKEP